MKNRQNKTIIAQELLKKYMMELRKQALDAKRNTAGEHHQKIIDFDIRKGLFNGEYVNRLVIFMKGTGCSQIKRNGGCTCCGFYSISNFGEKIEDSYYIKLIDKFIDNEDLNISKFPIICLYNDGSLLNDEEINFSVLLYMISKLNNIDTVKKIVIEAKVNDINERQLKEIRKLTKKEFDITVGYESANQKVRTLCVNRPFSNKNFEDKVRLAKSYDINIVPLLMAKPAFLSEYEAVEDFVSSLVYLENLELKRIDIELPTVVQNSLNYDLWINGMYKPIKNWSIIEILKRKEELNLKTPVYVSPMVYSMKAYDHAWNCDKCSEKIYNLFEQYNMGAGASIFDDVDCDCKREWEQMMKSTSNIDCLEDTVIESLNKLENVKINKEGNL